MRKVWAVNITNDRKPVVTFYRHDEARIKETGYCYYTGKRHAALVAMLERAISDGARVSRGRFAWTVYMQ